MDLSCFVICLPIQLQLCTGGIAGFSSSLTVIISSAGQIRPIPVPAQREEILSFFGTAKWKKNAANVQLFCNTIAIDALLWFHSLITVLCHGYREKKPAKQFRPKWDLGKF